MDDDLDKVWEMAARYASLALAEIAARTREERQPLKVDMKGLCREALGLSPVQMAYFCQQIVSSMPDVRTASTALTMFTNRLADQTRR